VLVGLLTVRSSLGVRHLGDLCVDWWLVEQHSSPRSADVALAYCVRNGNRMAIDSVTPWMERPFQVTRVTGPPHPGLVTAAVPVQCSTTPEALYRWLWALERGSRPAGGVSPSWRAAADCESPRRTCPGELVG